MARDLIHFAIRRALEKDGWLVTDDPLTIVSERTRFYIDIGARKFLTAEKNQEKIAVEIKTLESRSILEPFYCALGKFCVYRKAIKDGGHDRKLYLGISETSHNRLTKIQIFAKIIEEFKVNLIIVDLETEKIITWIS